MPGITHRSTRPPQLKTRLLSHGTLECRDIAASRRFYEEALGLEVVQQAPVALFIRLGRQHCYAVVENPRAQETSLMAHNGIDLASEEEVRKRVRHAPAGQGRVRLVGDLPPSRRRLCLPVRAPGDRPDRAR